MSSSFAAKTSAPQTAPPDPTKHVNYTLGMVLGVDDFIQEFAYLSGRDQWLARDLLGYGTVCGLQVTIETETTGPQVVVAAGVALNPRGQLIRVKPAQCASLNDWLKTQVEELLRRSSSPPSSAVNLYVVLCYRECPTDNVPIPGEPCRSEDEAMAPSRLADDFKLELRWSPPEQREEDALRDFIDWLRQVEITGASSTTLDEFLAAVHAATHFVTSPPSSPPESPPSSPPDFMYGSPPSGLGIPADQACEYLRAAFRIWVTELRPQWLGKNQSCGTPPDEGCVLLAELQVPLLQTAPGEWKVDDDPNNPVIINEARRPYLIHLRMLQEWLLCYEHATTASTSINPVNTVVTETAFDQAPDAGLSLEYSRADHTHGTPPDPIPAHVANPNAHSLGGNVFGPISNNVVQAIQNVPVVPTALIEGQVLTVRSGRWQADSPPAGSGDFVEHPKGLPRYFIVAAGIVRGDGTTTQPPVYNGLTAKASANSELTVRFTGYSKPTASFQYIVKALAVFNDQVKIPIITFSRFLASGIILRVTDGSGLIPQNQLATLEFMIEISRYET